jgi:uncharacterized protein (DUF58 family)
MKFIKTYLSALYFGKRFFAVLCICIILFISAFFLDKLEMTAYLGLLFFIIFAIFDYILLFSKKEGLLAKRMMAERFSNGDENEIIIYFENRYTIPVSLEVIDEVPVQFQKRDVLFNIQMGAKEQKHLKYQLRPVKRGIYNFGFVRVFVYSPIRFFSRRYNLEKVIDVPVYPSYLQLRKYQIMAFSNRLNEAGIKKVRRFGHSMEFEQIKEYVQGDDYRTLNWRATARRGQLMVNTYSDEKSQQIYCVIDKSRVMRMPFEGLSLLDYSINASLVLSNVALMKQDKAGIITFAENIGSFLKADKKALQMQSILETLYNQKTRYLESDYERLYVLLKTKVTQRSLIVLFTNFESLNSMHRQLPYLKKIATQHLLITVFFENTELDELLTATAATTEQVYTKTIAEQFVWEKRQIVKELNRYGIKTVLTSPQNLTVNTLNKYLETKARNLI